MQQHMNNIYDQDGYYPLINQKTNSKTEFQQVDHSDLQLFQYQLNFQQSLQYLLSILNFLLNQNYSQIIEFYANPTIKIKCYSQKQIFTFQTFKHKIDLRKFQTFLDQFIYYFQNTLLYDSQTDLIQQMLKQYEQPDEIEFQNSVRKLYNQLICHLDLKEYLKQELLYDIKDQTSPFAYKLNKCNYSICFNDNILKKPNGPGFLPVLQKIQGYKGFGNLFMINVGSDEWEVAHLHNCQYEMLLIFKKLSKASLHLYEQQMNFRSMSKHQIIKFHNSYRILFHNVEKSALTRYIDHYNHFICLYKQFLQDNQLDNTIAKEINNTFFPFFLFVKNLTEQLNLVYKSKGRILDIENIINNISQETDQYICKLNFSDQVKKQIKNLLQYFLGIDALNTQKDLEQLQISIIRQLESEVVGQLQNRINFFINSNFLVNELNSNGSQSNIYQCENIFTGRKFALARPKQNYDYSELKLSIQKINIRIPKSERKQIVKIYAIDESQMWMEYSNTGNLFNYLDKRKLEMFEALLISQQICQILQILHNNSLYHLDVKLENFLIFKKYGVNRIKVCDFGSMTDEKQFTFDMTKHRLLYSPPEAKENGLINSEKFDIWQLGQLFNQMRLGLEYPYLSNWLKHHNPQQRKSIREVIDQIGIFIENLMNNYIEYSLAWKCQVYCNEFEQEFDNDIIIAQKQFLDKVNYKTTYKRKDDGQIFKISQFDQKMDWGFLFNKYFQIYDIESSNNNWTQFCLFRKTSNIQDRINKQYWSLNQKTLYLNGLLKDLFSINYFQQDDHFYNQFHRKQPNSEQYEVGQQQQDSNMRKLFFKEAQNYAQFLNQKLIQENSEQEKLEEKIFMNKITIFLSFIIDILSHASKQNRFFLELKEIVKKIIYRKVQTVNKNSYLGNIQSLLLNMLDFSQQLQFKFLNKKIVRLKGFLYLVDDDVKKYYLRMTIEVANLGLDHVYLEFSQLNFPFQSIINFKKFNFENFELFKLDFENNLCSYMKFVAQQIILNYQGKNMMDSPFNLVEGVFIDKRSKCFIRNDIYFIDKDLDEQINLIRYFVLVIQQQLIIIGSCTFMQKLEDRLRQLQNESKNDQLDLQNQIHLIKSLITMNEMKNTLRLQQQLELIYFIQNLWNFDLINLLVVCNNLNKNKNCFQEFADNNKQEYITINQKSNFEYYISIENALNASKIYQVYLSSQLIPVIIYQQKQSKIIESNEKRIVIDSFRSGSFASKAQPINHQSIKQTCQIQEIFKYNVYLETPSIQLNYICRYSKLFSVFEWISLIQCLLSKFDVYEYYFQYLKTQFGRNLVIKLFLLIKCSDVLEMNLKEQIQNIILFYKEEHTCLNKISNIFEKMYKNIFKISKMMIQLGMQILNTEYNNFSFLTSLLQPQQFNQKQQNLIVYFSYFLFVNEQYEKDLYYDLEEEKLYHYQKQNSFHFKYHLLFEDDKLNKDLVFQLISSLLKNFQPYRLQSYENQLNYIVNQYNIQGNLEQLGLQIVQKLTYINPERIYIVRIKQRLDLQQFLCCYHLGQYYLNYDNFQVTYQNAFEYHCFTIVKLDGQLIRLKQIQANNILILSGIIQKLHKLALIIFNQGYQFDIREENLVFAFGYKEIIIYPVQIRKVQDTFQSIEEQINNFEKEIQENIVKAASHQKEKSRKSKIKDQISEISTDDSYYQQ